MRRGSHDVRKDHRAQRVRHHRKAMRCVRCNIGRRVEAQAACKRCALHAALRAGVRVRTAQAARRCQRNDVQRVLMPLQCSRRHTTRLVHHMTLFIQPQSVLCARKIPRQPMPDARNAGCVSRCAAHIAFTPTCVMPKCSIFHLSSALLPFFFQYCFPLSFLILLMPLCRIARMSFEVCASARYACAAPRRAARVCAPCACYMMQCRYVDARHEARFCLFHHLHASRYSCCYFDADACCHIRHSRRPSSPSAARHPGGNITIIAG